MLKKSGDYPLGIRLERCLGWPDEGYLVVGFFSVINQGRLFQNHRIVRLE